MITTHKFIYVNELFPIFVNKIIFHYVITDALLPD